MVGTIDEAVAAAKGEAPPTEEKKPEAHVPKADVPAKG
jgi:hypothetical protein